jgi:hypothetical protein
VIGLLEGKMLKNLLIVNSLIVLFIALGCGVDSESELDPGDTDSETETETDTGTDTDSETETDTDDFMLYEDFEQYEVGDYIVATAGWPWTSWSGARPWGLDAEVVDEQAYNGTKSLKFIDKTDVFLLLEYPLEDASVGIEIDFYVYVAEGMRGYYHFAEIMGEEPHIKGFEMFFDPGGQGRLVADKQNYPFEYPAEPGWLACSHVMNVKENFWEVRVQNDLVHKWQIWGESEEPPVALDAINFRDNPNEKGTTYYLDLIKVEELDDDN